MSPTRRRSSVVARLQKACPANDKNRTQRSNCESLWALPSCNRHGCRVRGSARRYRRASELLGCSTAELRHIFAHNPNYHATWLSSVACTELTDKPSTKLMGSAERAVWHREP